MGTSFPSGVVPPESVINIADVILLQSTGLVFDFFSLPLSPFLLVAYMHTQNRTGLAEMVKEVRSTPTYNRSPSPILIDADSAEIDNLAQAVSDSVSWGFFSQV